MLCGEGERERERVRKKNGDERYIDSNILLPSLHIKTSSTCTHSQPACFLQLLLHVHVHIHACMCMYMYMCVRLHAHFL